MPESFDGHPIDASVAPQPEQAAARTQTPENREERLARMLRCADSGRVEEKIDCAKRGRRIPCELPEHAFERAGAGLGASKPPRPPKPPRGDCRDDRPGAEDGAPFDRPHRRGRRRRMGRLMRRLVAAAVVLLLLIAGLLILWPRVQQALTPDFSVTLPDGIAGILPDETMGYNSVDFCNAILGESREQKELVVMEQDVEVTSQISQDLLNISLFSKQKIIHSFGTGVYTVDLDGMVSTDITVDEASGIITVAVPHTRLSYVSVDVDKTVFEDTKKSLLAVGEIKLTTEQKHILDQSVDSALHERLNDPALFLKADEIALNKARELFQAPVSALSDAYIVKIVMEPKR